jgi:hypothetical protein
MGSLVGAWMAVIGYALAYTGVGHFTGQSNVGFLQSLGYGPTPAQQAQQAAANAAAQMSPLGIIWQSILGVINPAAALGNAITNITTTSSSQQQPAPSSMTL